jgi:Cu(I)/Ag(I) efflux system periplasmic protein CusF
MKHSLVCAVLAATLGATAQAQQQSADHGAHHPTSTAAAADMADGEVRKIDKAALKLTLKHGEIKNLDMPPMTMVFGVQDKALLDKLTVGDKVRFKVINANGKYTVTEIRPQP